MLPKKEKTERSIMSLVQAADYLSLKKSTLYAYCHKHIIRFYKVRNRKVYFLKEDLDNFVLNEKNLVKSAQQISEEAAQHILKKDVGGDK
ncbi:MAG: helix-turn-helix domain-containing protein [Candidatus Cloacimonetes bacterium]|nr:helix-turn-helix domain-containing protein [Candidatus Cloacimonadota bacterium]